MDSVILIILDGWGIAPGWAGNAVFLARTPCFDELIKKFPHTQLSASGSAVGLSGDERGNSEAGHLNIGAGKIVHQDVNHISSLIQKGDFYQNPTLLGAIKHTKKYHSNLHLIGLLSDGGIHSHIDHLFALLNLCKKESVQNIYLHCFTDGRDTEPQKALSFIYSLERKIKELGIGTIATVSGRYYAMDRDKHWNRTERVYRAIAEGIGETEKSAASAVSQSYRVNITDEFIIPTVINPIRISDNDALIFFNVRGDRMRQLVLPFSDPNFNAFPVKKINNLCVVIFTWYGDYIPNTQYAFAPEKVENPLAAVLSENNLKQFHTAETEKYAHVTYFFNGGREEPFKNEDRIMIPSPKVPTYDLAPEMSVREVSSEIIYRIENMDYSFILANFANPDMVGHTGVLDAAVKAVEAVDRALYQTIVSAQKKGMYILVTADHGNAEQMVNPKTGETDTEHTKNPVPFILIPPTPKLYKLRTNGILADIAPTILEILNIPKPNSMTGTSLII